MDDSHLGVISHCIVHCFLPPCAIASFLSPSFHMVLTLVCNCMSALQVYDREGAGDSNWIHGREYNEFIVSATQWNKNLPHTIEAFFYRCAPHAHPSEEREASMAAAHSMRTLFLEAYNLPSWRAPIVCINTRKWGGTGPFELIQG